jgi:hypothetical protein
MSTTTTKTHRNAPKERKRKKIKESKDHHPAKFNFNSATDIFTQQNRITGLLQFEPRNH